MTAIQTEGQSLNPSAIVSLFTLDTTKLGGPLLRFCQGTETHGSVKFGGQTYEAVDVEFNGLETSGVGALPTPTITFGNSSGIVQMLVNTYGDMLGCKLYRVRTFAKFLDDQAEADPEAFYGPDIFQVERKTAETDTAVSWELSAAIDQEGRMLPARVIVRDTCLWRYRIWNEGTRSWDYSNAQCPYVGNKYFDINDQPVTSPVDDQPSRRLSCCKARFGANNPLPFGGFPGVARN